MYHTANFNENRERQNPAVSTNDDNCGEVYMLDQAHRPAPSISLAVKERRKPAKLRVFSVFSVFVFSKFHPFGAFVPATHPPAVALLVLQWTF